MPVTGSPVAPVLAADGVTFSYNGGAPVVEDVTLSVLPGEFVALVGPNGSGKSTLLRVLLGLLSPTSGTVQLFGEIPSRLSRRSRLGYVPQRPALAPDFPGTVEEVVAAGLTGSAWWRRARAGARAEVDHAIEAVALGDVRQRRVSELSGGQQQRAFIAKALVSSPELLVLDEPVAGVDADSQRRFRDSLVHLVEQHAAAVLLVSHELGAVADDLDRVIVLRRRVLFDGKAAELTDAGVSLGVHTDDLPRWLEGLDP